jgi:transposase-like protein
MERVESVNVAPACGAAPPEGSENTRNGESSKTASTDEGLLHPETPRDRAGTFEPRLIGKHKLRFTGYADRIIALYARGMTVLDMQHSMEMYGVDVSPPGKGS